MLFVGYVSEIDKFLSGMLHMVDMEFGNQAVLSLPNKVAKFSAYFFAADTYTVATMLLINIFSNTFS
ncbi:hypothetical protein EAE90_18185 [Photorhabdus caribbeanensis]|nr:hypothetical protein [Photorhabdus caribbeanensis]